MEFTPILLAVAIVAGLGLLLGLGLAIASVVMAVPVDQKAEELREILPGANCGACGYSGCDGYASALSKAITKNTTLCSPGGNETSKMIAKITGFEANEVKPIAAVVLCQGTSSNCGSKMVYQGVESCRMAKQLFGGPKECIYGCIGYGDCIDVCPYDAIHLCDGVARVNPLACRACKKCIKACPNSLIKMMPLQETKAAVLCANKDKGALTRKECKAGCIGCKKCEKTCEFDAIKIKDFCAKIEMTKCTGCGECVEVCPVDAIKLISL